jgi:glycosyltransferase involved in cell wall biosynthesis
MENHMMPAHSTLRHLPIALIGPLPPPSGGMANQTRQLARLLEESGLQVELVQVNLPYCPTWIVSIPFIRALFRLIPYLLRLWRIAGQVRLMHVMANSGWSWHLFAAPAVWIGWLRKTPVIINYRGGEAEAFFGYSWRWVRPTVTKATFVVVPSGFLENVFARRGISTRIVPNIVDLECFYPNNDRQEHPLRLLVARNLEPVYDIATALKAFALIKKQYTDAKLSIAGSGPLLLDLKQLSEQLEIAESVTFTGRLDNKKMAEIYRGTDLLLNSSLADNMPISLLEGLASGVPIVTTNVGGIPYLVEEGQTALLIDPNHPQAMAAAAMQVLSDPDLAALLRKNGLAVVQNYAWSKVREKWFAVYIDALQDDRLKKSEAPL